MAVLNSDLKTFRTLLTFLFLKLVRRPGGKL